LALPLYQNWHSTFWQPFAIIESRGFIRVVEVLSPNSHVESLQVLSERSLPAPRGSSRWALPAMVLGALWRTHCPFVAQILGRRLSLFFVDFRMWVFCIGLCTLSSDLTISSRRYLSGDKFGLPRLCFSSVNRALQYDHLVSYHFFTSHEGRALISEAATS